MADSLLLLEIQQDHKNYPQATYYKILDSVKKKKYVLRRKHADDFATHYVKGSKTFSHHLMLQDATLHTLVLDVDYVGTCTDIQACVSRDRKFVVERICDTLLQFGIATNRKLAAVGLFLWSSQSGGYHVYWPEFVISSEDYEILLKQLQNIVSCKCSHAWKYDECLKNFPLAKAGKNGKSFYKIVAFAFLHMNQKKVYMIDNLEKLCNDLQDVSKNFKFVACASVEKQQLDHFLVSKLRFLIDNRDTRLLQFPFPVTKQYRYLLFALKFRMETCDEATDSDWTLKIEKSDGELLCFVKRNCKLFEVRQHAAQQVSELYSILTRACSYLKSYHSSVFGTQSDVVKQWVERNIVKATNSESVLSFAIDYLQREMFCLRKKKDPVGYILTLAPDTKVPLLYACCNLAFKQSVPHTLVCREFLDRYGRDDECVKRFSSLSEDVARHAVHHFESHALIYIAQSVLFENVSENQKAHLFPSGKTVGENTLLKEEAYKDYADLFVSHNIETIEESEGNNPKKKKSNKSCRELQKLVSVCESILTRLVSSLFPVVWTTSEGKNVQFIWLGRHWCDVDSSTGEKTLRTLLKGLFYELSNVYGDEYPIHGLCEMVVSKAETHFDLQKLKKKNETTCMDETTHLICLKNGSKLFNLLTLSVHRNVPHFFTTSRCEISWDGSYADVLLDRKFLGTVAKFMFDPNSLASLCSNDISFQGTNFRRYVRLLVDREFAHVNSEIQSSLGDVFAMILSCASVVLPRVVSLCKLLAYSLIGVNVDKKLVVFWGPAGDNGKTIFFTTLKQVFGGCVGVLQQDVLMKKKEASEREKDIAENIFRRLVYVDDNGNGALNPDLIKDLTGGGKRTVRRIYRSPVNKYIMFVLFMSMNDPPTCEGEPAQAFLKRICLIKWESQFLSSLLECNSIVDCINKKTYHVEQFTPDNLTYGFISILAASLLQTPEGFFDLSNGRILDVESCNEESKVEFLENMEPLGKFIQWSNLVVTTNDAITLSTIRVQTMIRKFIVYKRWTGGVTLEQSLMKKFRDKFKEYLRCEEESQSSDECDENNQSALKLLSKKKKRKKSNAPTEYFKCLQFRQT